MAIDLHSHSTASDGSAEPSALVRLAVEQGLTTLALTDHDTQEGIEEARAATAGTDLELIAGTELSLEYDAGGMHLLVLWLEPGSGPLQSRLATLRQWRNRRNEQIVAALTELGMPMTIDEVTEEAGSGSVGRPHIAAVMMAKGYVESIEEAFEHWLAAGKPAYWSRPRLRPEEAIQLALESGGVPILAHPHTLNINRAAEMADLLTELCKAGLVGLEAIYSSYRQHERDGYADLARRFGLVPSGGSDYHGSYKPGLDLGRGYGDLVVPDSVLDDLRRHAANP
ncbi:MAG: PHP domain-containing protein [Acidobacteria bacterium]|nr:PHP domain-containing protein [Acidobacteriota bacterium]